MSKDLGTYHLRVEFTDGSGYIQQVSTGNRFCNGMDSTHPLNADHISPTWDDETEMVNTMLYMYTDGSYACDCNRKLFLAQANQRPELDAACGDELKLKKITVIRPDMTEFVAYPVKPEGGE
jgi:hypothetical protein